METKIIIDSRLKLMNISNQLVHWLSESLTFENPLYLEAVKRGRYIRNISPNIKLYSETPNGIVIPRGYLQTIEEILIGKGNDISIIDNRVFNKPIHDIESNIVLRDYQSKAKTDLLRHPNGMLVAPAGSGKTIMGLDIFCTLKQNMLWLTHTNRLADQVKERILGNNDMPPAIPSITEEDIGMIGSGKKKITNKITIGMIQTLVRNLDLLIEISQEFGLIIIDEAHHVPSSTFLKVINYLPSYYMFGLTAVPYRRDGLENVMFASIGRLNSVVQRKTVKKEEGIITPTAVIRKIYGQKYDDNDYSFAVSEILMKDKERCNMIVHDIVNEAKNGNFCIAISVRKLYCEIIYNKIINYWNKTGIATGDYNKKHNDLQVKRLEEGDISVLITTFNLLGEGFDVRKLNRGFLILPFREKSRVEQAIGRIQRPSDGKTDAYFYDYVDNNVGILRNQFMSRQKAYRSLGVKILNDNNG